MDKIYKSKVLIIMFWRHIKLTLFSCFCFFCLNSCVLSTLIEQGDVIVKKHKTIAIIPPKVGFCFIPDTTDVTLSYESRKQNCAYYLQKCAYENYLINKEKYFIDIQDINTTNLILSEKMILYQDLEKIDYHTLADLLGVDAVLYLEFKSKTFKTGGTPRTGYVSYIKVATDVKGILYTSEQGIWNAEGGMASAYNCFNIWEIKSLIKKIIRQLPYKKK